jgi:FSR family fosmidomycin resistance protein-like MFS transporter
MTAMTAPAEVSTERRSFVEVWLITIGHAMTHWYPATFYVLAPLIGHELGLSYTQIASIVTAQAIAGALSNIPGGIITDTVPRKGLLMALSLAWVGIPYMIMATSQAYWMLLACAVLIGVGNTLWHPTAIPTLAKRFSERKGLVVSIHGMGGNVGDAVAPFVAGTLVSGVAFGSLFSIPAISWRQVMIFNVIPGILMAVAILWYLGRLQMKGKGKAAEQVLNLKEVIKGFSGLLKNSTLMMLVVSSAFRSMTQGSLLVFLPLYLANTMGYSAWAVGTAMMALQLCGFIAAPIAGGLSDKVGRRSIMMSSMAMTAVVLLFMIFAGGTEAFVFLVALLGFFLFAIRAVLQAWTLDATPKGMGGSAIGLLFGIQAIGTSIGPLVCGLLADRFGLLSTFYFMAGTIVLANMFVFFIPDIRKAATAKA